MAALARESVRRIAEWPAAHERADASAPRPVRVSTASRDIIFMPRC